MNIQLEAFARSQLIDWLNTCSEAQQLTFKRMYSHNHLDRDINEVVSRMGVTKLDWAMTQVKRTVDKNESKDKK